MKVAIITEGLSGTGYGHLTRCLSIYQAFEEIGVTPLYIANCDENGRLLVGDIRLKILDWLNKTDELLDVIKDFDIAIIDSYLAQIEVYDKIKMNVTKAVYLDDYMRLDYPQGIVINGTIGAEKMPYKSAKLREYWLGIKFMPLRMEFWDVRINSKKKNDIKNILVCFGGQDNSNLTQKVLIKLLKEFTSFNYLVVYGQKNKRMKFDKHNVNYYYSLNAAEMLSVMLQCDLAITAAGQTTYELARVGIPFVPIGVADNQKYNLEGWFTEGQTSRVFWKDCISNPYFNNEIRTKLNGQNKITEIVDGQGARRIIEKLLNQI